MAPFLGKTLLLTVRQQAAKSNAEVLAADGYKFSLSLHEEGQSEGAAKCVYGQHGDVRMLGTFVNWMVCQGVEHAVGFYGCLIFGEFGEEYGADAQWALLELKRHLAGLPPARRPKVVLLSCVLRDRDLHWWERSGNTEASGLSVGLHIVQERNKDLAHYQVLDGSGKDPWDSAQSIIVSLHKDVEGMARTMIFGPGVPEIVSVMKWARAELGCRTKCVAMHSGSPLGRGELDGSNVLIVCTDYAGAGITIDNIQDVILTMRVNRQIGGDVQQTLCSEGDAVNFAGRSARTCDGRVWFIGNYFSVPPVFPTLAGREGARRAVTVVWGTNARVSHAAATMAHLEGRGFQDVHFLCGADRCELTCDAEKLWNKLCMLNCVLFLVPALLSTDADCFYIFEDTARLRTSVGKWQVDEACGDLPAANFAYDPPGG